MWNSYIQFIIKIVPHFIKKIQYTSVSKSITGMQVSQLNRLRLY